MKKIKQFFKSLIGQSILGVISTIIANLIVEQITQFNILKFLGQKIWELIKIIWNFLNIKVAIGGYIIIDIALILILTIYVKIINEQEKIEEPDFLKYNEDKYKGRVKFRWQYEKDYNGKYTLCNFIPICECGCQLDEKWQIGNRHFGTEQYVCPKCGKQYGNVLDYDEMQSFNKILISNIQNGEYKDVNRK